MKRKEPIARVTSSRESAPTTTARASHSLLLMLPSHGCNRHHVELVESGYTSVTFTIQGEFHTNDYQVLLATQCCNSTSNESDIRINNNQNKKSTEMKETKKDLSAEFFSTAESDIKTIATATMEAAMNSKELSDSEFESAIADASNGMVTLRRSISNPNRVDFCCWEAFTATHAPLIPARSH